MPGQVRAVIDIGTNSVKLLVAEVEGSQVVPLHESSHQTRLGQGFYESHVLQTVAIRETAKSVHEFGAAAEQLKAASILVIATSAARDAKNSEELLSAIRATAGLEIRILSGEEEADWAYRGVASDPGFYNQSLLVIDVGGGSTEFILGRGGERVFAASFPLGSVRLLEKLPPADPPSAAQLASYEREVDAILEQDVRPQLRGFLEKDGSSAELIGTGGTATILARMKLKANTFDRAQIEKTVLPLEYVRLEKQRLWTTPLQERRNIVGLPANRADVILPGMLIFERLMTCFGFSALRVSTRGVRFGALLGERSRSGY